MSGRLIAETIRNLPDDVIADLVTTNELGQGERDYRLAEDGQTLLVDLYITDLMDADGMPVPDITYEVGVSLTVHEPA
jgi:hypothetical protein